MSQSPCLDENTALELLDGKLSSATRSKVERHLEECDACRELVAELAKVDGDENANANANAREREEIGADTERTPFGQAGHAPNAMPLAAMSKVGPYRIEHAIGSGASGTVYRAIDERTSQVVALKMVTDTALRARFAREAATLSRLSHPAIVGYIAHGETPNGMYLAMEWLDGEDLEQRLRRGPLGWQGARALGLRLSAALSHAHALGCVHRDMSPRNVFLPLGQIDQAKLLDFGLVRIGDSLLFPQTSKLLERTTSQALLGTPFYMSPEQVRDPKSVDGRSDLFGLGVLLYESIAGVRPFQGADLFSVWVQIVDQKPPDLRGLAQGQAVPESLVLLIEALLSKEPSARPSSASDVHRALSTMASHGSGTLAMPAATTAPPPSPAIAMPGSTAQYTSSYPPHPMLMQSSPPPHPHPSLINVNARSIPVPPRPRTGVYIAAGVGVTAALVTATSIAVYAAAKRGAPTTTLTPGSANGQKPVGTDVNGHPLPKGSDDSDDDDDSSPSSSSGKAAVPGKPRAKPPGRYFCGGDTVETKRGGHYEPEQGFADIGEAVWVGGDCKATLEDCIIGGKHSVLLLGTTLTLRRCKVQGEVKLVGDKATLHLEGTTLPQTPVIVGKGKVIRH